MLSRRQKWWLILVFVAVWAFSIIAPAFFHNYKPSPEVSASFPVIIGAIIAIPTKDDGEKGD